ncbi:unnamed protein product [Brassica oleracea var. botrytis]
MNLEMFIKSTSFPVEERKKKRIEIDGEVKGANHSISRSFKHASTSRSNIPDRINKIDQKYNNTKSPTCPDSFKARVKSK